MHLQNKLWGVLLGWMGPLIKRMEIIFFFRFASFGPEKEKVLIGCQFGGGVQFLFLNWWAVNVFSFFYSEKVSQPNEDLKNFHLQKTFSSIFVCGPLYLSSAQLSF